MKNEFRDRLTLAIIEALKKEDPLLTMAVGSNEIRITWPGEGDQQDEIDRLLRHDSE